MSFSFFRLKYGPDKLLTGFERFAQLEVGSGIRRERNKETLTIAWVAVFALCHAPSAFNY